MIKKARFINGYGPQENYDEETKLKFFNRLDLEIKSSKVAGAFVCIELDANSKLGPCFVPSAPGEQSKNGKMLERVIKDSDQWYGLVRGYHYEVQENYK